MFIGDLTGRGMGLKKALYIEQIFVFILPFSDACSPIL